MKLSRNISTNPKKGKRKMGTNNRWKKSKANNKVITLNSGISIITLNVIT